MTFETLGSKPVIPKRGLFPQEEPTRLVSNKQLLSKEK